MATAKDPQVILELDPRTLKADPAMRARAFSPGDDRVAELAASMLNEGQIQPIEVRNVAPKGADPEYAVVIGYTRHEAALLIRQGFTLGGEEYKNPRFKLRAVEVKVTEDEAFIHAIVENRHRNRTSPIDDAHNIARLLEMGKSQAEIAQLYDIDQAAVSRSKKLLELTEDEQRMVHIGELPSRLAYELLKLDPAERIELLRSAVAAATGKAPRAKRDAIGKAVRKAVAAEVDKTEGDDEPEVETKAKAKPAPAKTKAAAKTVATIREFLTDFHCEHEPLRNLLDTIVEWTKGGITDKKFGRYLEQWDLDDSEADEEAEPGEEG